MGKRNALDKFYTKQNIVKICLSYIELNKYTCVIEPAAGAGAFSIHLPRAIAMDIKPEGEGIIPQDFLCFDVSDVKGKILVIGNPPFGRQCSMALKFIKHAMRWADTVAFILPRSFCKISMQDKVPLNFILTQEFNLPKNSFLIEGVDYDVPSVFQVWERSEILRKKSIKATPVSGYSFCKYKKDADISLQRNGSKAGKAAFNLTIVEDSQYFLKIDNQNNINTILKRLNEIKWEHNNTTGPKSIGKQEFIVVMNEIIEQLDFTENYLELLNKYKQKNLTIASYSQMKYKTTLAGLIQKGIIESLQVHEMKVKAG